MASFNWHDEETGWEVSKEPKQPPQKQAPNHSRGLFFPGLVTILIILSIVFGVAWWRVQTVEEQLREEVMKSWRLVVDSALNDDPELLVNQLSGRDPDWVSLQQQILLDGSFLGRAATLPSLETIPERTVSLDTITIEFEPEQTAAILEHQISYLDGWGNIIRFQQEELFRQGRDRWLYSPPEFEEADLTPIEVRGERVTFFAPTSDIDQIRAIMTSFDAKLDDMCSGGIEFVCTPLDPLTFVIRFEPQLTPSHLELENLFGDLRGLNNRVEILLPSPFLLGEPVTETDEEALIQAYNAILLEPYLLFQVSESAGRLDPFMVGITQYLLSRFEAGPPMSVADYQRIQESIDAVELAFNQNRVVGDSFPDARQFMGFPVRTTFRALVEFRLLEGDISVQELLNGHLSGEAQPIFPTSLITVDRWEEFRDFVEIRSSLAPISQ